MPLIISNISCPYFVSEEAAFSKAKKLLSLPKGAFLDIHTYKRSIDARRQNDIRFVYSVFVDLKDPALERKLAQKIPDVRYQPDSTYDIPKGHKKLSAPIVVVGMGPAGLFAAYRLAQYGFRPIVFERGSDINTRCQDVDHFWKDGVLDTNSNVQFGEGGAGAFSDGKLTTRISDRRCGSVLKIFTQFGAPEEICHIAKPHIGTDLLCGVIQNMRKEIIRLGGRVYFHHKLDKLLTKDGRLTGIVVNGAPYETHHLILAIGHSARDTFRMLSDEKIMMQNKPFSVGVRIEHQQRLIDRGLYGKLAGDNRLPPGEYQLSHHLADGHCVYTFCMCPGGLVIPSASEENTVVTNGMSYHARNGENANAALVVSVSERDYGDNPLSGIAYQQNLECAAFAAGGRNYQAPAAFVGNFLRSGKPGMDAVSPSYVLGVKECDLAGLFPSFIRNALAEGLRVFNRKIPGFASNGAILTGVETRTSSPVRILRDERFESVSLPGLYPCGEGAGYAGGIVSAAVDGLRIAEQLISEYSAESC